MNQFLAKSNLITTNEPTLNEKFTTAAVRRKYLWDIYLLKIYLDAYVCSMVYLVVLYKN